MAKLSRNQVSVTNGAWSVSCETGTGIEGAILKVFKIHDRKGGLRKDAKGRPIPFSGTIFQYGDSNGKRFASTDEAFAYALERGYSRVYHTAPDLRARRLATARAPWEPGKR